MNKKINLIFLFLKRAFISQFIIVKSLLSLQERKEKQSQIQIMSRNQWSDDWNQQRREYYNLANFSSISDKLTGESFTTSQLHNAIQPPPAIIYDRNCEYEQRIAKERERNMEMYKASNDRMNDSFKPMTFPSTSSK